MVSFFSQNIILILFGGISVLLLNLALVVLMGNQERVIPSGVVPRGISGAIKEIPRRKERSSE